MKIMGDNFLKLPELNLDISTLLQHATIEQRHDQNNINVLQEQLQKRLEKINIHHTGLVSVKTLS